jgi:DNA primase
MAISDKTVERIREASDIVSVIREYVPGLKKSGRDWKACCPFHHEKTPSFSVSPERGIFKCFGCNAAGDIFKFVQTIENISWIESVKKLAARASIEIEENRSDFMRTSQKAKLFEILESAANFYHRYLLESPKAAKARKYLAERGVHEKSIEIFKLGYAGKNNLLKAASKKGISIQELAKAGIIKESQSDATPFEYMSERLVFPIFDLQGRVVSFGGRTLSNQNPKYINGPETQVFSKSANLYGLFQTLSQLRKERKITIVEGYMDVVIPRQFGISGFAAPLGTAIAQNHITLIKRYAESAVLLFDADDAGRSATRRTLEIFIENSVQTTISHLPQNVDADEYLTDKGKDSFLDLLKNTSQSPIAFMIEAISQEMKSQGPEDKAKAASALLDFVLRSPNSVIQDEWIKEIAKTLNTAEGAIREEFRKKQVLNFRVRNASISRKAPKKPQHSTNQMNPLGNLQEQLLRIVLFDAIFLKEDLSKFFTQGFEAKIFNLALKGKSIDEISAELDDFEKEKFEKLLSIRPVYPKIQESFTAIVKSLEKTLLKEKESGLKTEVILMLDEKMQMNEDKLKEYMNITKRLKGSPKEPPRA